MGRGRDSGIEGLCVNQSSICLQQPPVKTARPLFILHLHALSRPRDSPLPRIPISITGHHPLPIRPPIDALQFHVRVSKITNLSNSLPYSRSLFRNEARRPGSKEIRRSLEERETSFAQRHSNTSNHTEKLYYIRRLFDVSHEFALSRIGDKALDPSKDPSEDTQILDVNKTSICHSGTSNVTRVTIDPFNVSIDVDAANETVVDR